VVAKKALTWNQHENVGLIAPSTVPRALQAIRRAAGFERPDPHPGHRHPRNGTVQDAVRYGANLRGRWPPFGVPLRPLRFRTGPDFADAARKVAAKLREDPQRREERQRRPVNHHGRTGSRRRGTNSCRPPEKKVPVGARNPDARAGPPVPSQPGRAWEANQRPSARRPGSRPRASSRSRRPRRPWSSWRRKGSSTRRRGFRRCASISSSRAVAASFPSPTCATRAR